MNIKTILLGVGMASSFSAWAQNPEDAGRTGARADLAPFYHGVASGDPLTDAVIIWTRVTTDSASVQVSWKMATDTAMLNVVASGLTSTDASKDYTVKVDVTGLQPNTFYYYEFMAYNKYSVRGRTKTAPTGDVDSIRFAVVSCSNLPQGYFNAYNRITARNDVDAVLHLGDYIYEYGDGQYGTTRPYDPANEIITLSDYRVRHSQYKLDQDLMRMHQQYPMMAIWDDHETANNSWYGGAENHTPGTEGDWFARKDAGIRAYYEWMPLRMPDQQDTQRIYRKFSYGDLLDLYMLDTRLEGREVQNGTGNTSPTRTLLGQQQFNWLCSNMRTSNARWQILGQQVMMAPLNVQPLSFLPPIYPNDDQWDGYSGERLRLYDTLFSNNIQNMVVLTGDIHTSWGNDLPTDTYNGSTGAGSAGVEFVITSVTSPGLDFLAGIGSGLVMGANDHMKYVDLEKHGYLILDINKTRTQGEWIYVDRIDAPSTVEAFDEAWYCNNGERHLRQGNNQSVANPGNIGVPAPLDPRIFVTGVKQTSGTETVLLGVYPNPFEQQLTLQYHLHQAAKVEITLFDLQGRQVLHRDLGTQSAGLVEERLDLPNLPAGSYVVVVHLGDKKHQRMLVKR